MGRRYFRTATAKEIAATDAIHDTVHEMARDEARHGNFKGLLQGMCVLQIQMKWIIVRAKQVILD